MSRTAGPDGARYSSRWCRAVSAARTCTSADTRTCRPTSWPRRATTARCARRNASFSATNSAAPSRSTVLVADDAWPSAQRFVALPLLRTERGLDAIGISAAAPGAYAEQVVVEESLMFAVPNGLPTAVATLTEPMAIGWHAVRRSEVKTDDVAIVIGCGPVGLAVVSMLKARGVRTVVASDLSPARRALAQACGADLAVDPGRRLTV